MNYSTRFVATIFLLENIYRLRKKKGTGKESPVPCAPVNARSPAEGKP